MAMLLAECVQCHTMACIATQMMPCEKCGRVFGWQVVQVAMVDPESKALITDAVLPDPSEIEAVTELDIEEEHITPSQVFLGLVGGLSLGVAGVLVLHVLFRYWIFR